MKSIKIFLALCFLSFHVLSQSRIDTQLQKKITLMAIEDQKGRKESETIDNGKTSAYDNATIDYNWRKNTPFILSASYLFPMELYVLTGLWSPRIKEGLADASFSLI